MEDKKRDIQMVERSLGGDAEAFGKLFEIYVKPVYRFIFFKVGSKEIAEDLTSTTFEKAFKGLSGFDERKFFKTWLFTIAKNTVIDFYRSKKSSFSIGELEDVFPDEEDLASEVQLRDEAKRLLSLIPKLKKEWKKIVEFKYIFELTNEEISYMTGMSEGNIRVILTRGIKRLKQLIKHDRRQDKQNF